MKKLILLIFFIPFLSGAQFTFGVKISGLAFHPQKELNEKNYRWKLDKKGHFVAFVGISFTSAYYFNDYIGIKTAHTLMPFDCAGKFSLVNHIGIDIHDRVIGWKNDEHRFSASFGPLWYFRRGWTELEDYEPETGFMKPCKNPKWERKFVWYGGQIQYDYYFKENQALSVNFFPGHPYIYSFGIGETFRIE